MVKKRADVLVFERGLAPSRERARALILAGLVSTTNRRIEKAGEQIAEDAELNLKALDHPYASRGGLKLEGALDDFSFDPKGLVVADFGASTGGFTDCLLQRGALKVFAIDVGYGQLHNKLRNDERVVVMERVNARHITELPEPVDLVVIDASFISLGKLMPAAKRVLKPGGHMLALVKPQFEAGPDNVKGGVVRDDETRERTIIDVIEEARTLGFEARGRTDAKIHGPKGNREALVLLTLTTSFAND